MKIILHIYLISILSVPALFAQTNSDTASLQLPSFIVKANFPAYLQALEQQRQADGIVNVLNLDLPGRFPDLNPAEALQRLPGIVLQRSHGEGRFVHIRGADPAWTTVQIDGEQIISPEAHNRFLQFDLLPVDQLRAVEVWKTNRPDQDGDAIGGTINLLTRNISEDKSPWQGAIALGYNPAAERPNGQAQLAYSGKHLRINGSLWQDHRSTENLETGYGVRENVAEKQLFISDVELRHFNIDRRRLGLSAEYELPFKEERGRAYLRGILVDFEEKNLRQRLRYRPGKGEISNLTDTIFHAGIGRDIRYVRETERFSALQTGVEHKSKRWEMDAALAYSHGLESEPEGRELDFKLTGVDLIPTSTNSNFPQYNSVNEKSPFDYNDFILNELEEESDQSTDQAITIRTNARYQLFKGKGYLKIGAKARLRSKRSRASERIYDDYTGTSPLALNEYLQEAEPKSFLGKRYDFGQFMDWNKAKHAIDANYGHFQLNAPETAVESASGNFDIGENSASTFALFHLEKGPIEWLAGARFEHTAYNYAADQVSIDSTGAVTRLQGGRKFSGHYGFLLPTVMLKYLTTNGLRWQTALGASYARPTFDQLAPYELFDQLNQIVTAGNPNLQPAFAWNFDIEVEKPLAKGGSLSAGLFAKHIDHFIFTQQSRDSRLWGGSQVNVLTSVPINGHIAWLAGAELGWQQRLTFLPGAWSGLGIFANYTYTWSRATLDEENSGSEEEEGFRLPGQAAHSGNMALWYDRKRWSGRLALNGQSDFLLQAAEPEESESQQIYGAALQLDATIGFSLGPHFTLFVEGMNLLNTPLRQFTGDKHHPSKLEYYGAWGRLGLKFVL